MGRRLKGKGGECVREVRGVESHRNVFSSAAEKSKMKLCVA